MWYFTWFLGTLLACFFGIIGGVIIDYREQRQQNDAENS